MHAIYPLAYPLKLYNIEYRAIEIHPEHLQLLRDFACKLISCFATPCGSKAIKGQQIHRIGESTTYLALGEQDLVHWEQLSISSS